MHHHGGWDDHTLRMEVPRSEEWKYEDIGTELPRSEEWNMNGNTEIRGFEVSGTKI